MPSLLPPPSCEELEPSVCRAGNMRGIRKNEAPRPGFCRRDPDPPGGHHPTGGRGCANPPRAGRKEGLGVVATVNPEGLGQFAGTGAQSSRFGGAPPILHQSQASDRFQGPQEHETRALRSLRQDIEEPVHPIIEVDVTSPGGVIPDKVARAGPEGGVASRITVLGVGLRLDDDALAGAPAEMTADHFAGAAYGVPRKP